MGRLGEHAMQLARDKVLRIHHPNPCVRACITLPLTLTNAKFAGREPVRMNATVSLRFAQHTTMHEPFTCGNPKN